MAVGMCLCVHVCVMRVEMLRRLPSMDATMMAECVWGCILVCSKPSNVIVYSSEARFQFDQKLNFQSSLEFIVDDFDCDAGPHAIIMSFWKPSENDYAWPSSYQTMRVSTVIMLSGKNVFR